MKENVARCVAMSVSLALARSTQGVHEATMVTRRAISCDEVGDCVDAARGYDRGGAPCARRDGSGGKRGEGSGAKNVQRSVVQCDESR